MAALVALGAAFIAYCSSRLHINLEKKRDDRKAAASRLEMLLQYKEHTPWLCSAVAKIHTYLSEWPDEQLVDAITRKMITIEIIPPAIATYPAGAQYLPPTVRLGLSAAFVTIQTWNDFVTTVTEQPFGPDRAPYVGLAASLRSLVDTCKPKAEPLMKDTVVEIGKADRMLE